MILTIGLWLALWQSGDKLCLAGDYKTPVSCNQYGKLLYCCLDDILTKPIEQSLREHPLPPDPKTWNSIPLTLSYTDADEGSWDALTKANQNKTLVIPGALTYGRCKNTQDITIETLGGKGKVYCMHLKQ